MNAIVLLAALTAPVMPQPHLPVQNQLPQLVAHQQWQVPRNFHFTQQQFLQPQLCRVRAFFGSDVSKPLEAVYFARHGSGCEDSYPYFGFVTITR